MAVHKTLQCQQHGGQSQSRCRHDKCCLHQFQGHWPHCLVFCLVTVATWFLGKPLPFQVLQQTELQGVSKPKERLIKTIKTIYYYRNNQ